MSIAHYALDFIRCAKRSTDALGSENRATISRAGGCLRSAGKDCQRSPARMQASRRSGQNHGTAPEGNSIKFNELRVNSA